jgi:phospholipid/cholesterol/gamma-HCH transport system substrate-binding protein
MPYRKMLISVGIFVLVIATLLVFSIGYVMQKQGVFEKKFHYTLFAKSGADLIEGMPILYSGFEIGVVTKLTLTDEGKVEVIIEIPKHEQRWLKDGSVFYLNKPLIGSATIIVETPDLAAAELSESKHQTLETKDGINELIGKVQPVLDDLQGIVSNVNHITSKESDLSKTMHNVEQITAKLSQTKAVTHIDDILSEVLHSITEIRTSLTDAQEGIMHQVSDMIEHADSGILGDKNSSLSRINDMLDDIAMKLQKLNKTVDAVNDASGDIKGLSSDIKFTIKKTDEVINGLNGIVGSSPSGEVTLP